MQADNENSDDNNKENIAPPSKRRRVESTEKIFRKKNGQIQRFDEKRYPGWVQCPSVASDIDTIRDILTHTYKDAYKDHGLLSMLFKLCVKERICDTRTYISSAYREKCSTCTKITSHPDYKTILHLFESPLFFAIKTFLSSEEYTSEYVNLSIQFDCNNKNFCVSNLMHQRRHKENAIITASLSLQQFVIHSSFTKDHIIYSPKNPKNITAAIIHTKLHKYFSTDAIYCTGFIPPHGITRVTHSGVFPTAQFLPNGRVTNINCEIIANKAPNKKLCNKCYRSSDTFIKHTIKREKEQPSKFIPYCKLSTIEQAQKYRAKVKELHLTKRKYKRLKKTFESRDTVVITNASANEQVFELLTYLSKNIDKLNDALINQPLLLSFIQDQLQASLQENKV